MRVWLLVVVVACGRVGFDPIDPSNGDGGGACDVAACAGIGGTCSNGQCVVDVTTNSPLTCPPGLDCTFECSAASSCSSGIDCAQASHCTIDCMATESCEGGMISCSAGGCDTYCSGSPSCEHLDYMCTPTKCIVQCCDGMGGICGNDLGGATETGAACP